MELRTLRYFVAVAEERHFGRAATRLTMTQPPLSRAIQQLESNLGATLLVRSPTGVALTAAGAVLYDEARALLEHAEHARDRVAATAEPATTLTVGTLVDSVDEIGTDLVETFRRRHPALRVRVREADFTDPTVGLRAGLVDVGLTRLPFDTAGISTAVLRRDRLAAVLRADDPLAGEPQLRRDDLAGRTFFQLPDATDALWRSYWHDVRPSGHRLSGPTVRTAHECLQTVRWNATVGLIPLPHDLPDGLVAVPLVDAPPSTLVVAWATDRRDRLVTSFVRATTTMFRGVR